MSRIIIEFDAVKQAAEELRGVSRDLAAVQASLQRIRESLPRELTDRRGIGPSLCTLERSVKLSGGSAAGLARLAAHAASAYQATERRLKKMP